MARTSVATAHRHTRPGDCRFVAHLAAVATAIGLPVGSLADDVGDRSAGHVAFSLGSTASLAALAPINDHPTHGQFWHVLHGALAGGPVTGYLSAGCVAESWRGVAARSTLMGATAALGAYGSEVHVLTRRERNIATVAAVGIGLSAAWDIAHLPAAIRRQDALGPAPNRVSDAAFALSVTGTLLPAMLALAPREGGLAVAGVVVGPATGYVYGHRTLRGLAGVVLRGAAAASTIDWSLDGGSRSSDGRVVFGSLLCAGSAAYDLWRVRDAVRPRARPIGVRLEPSWSPTTGSRLAMRLEF